MKSFAWWRSRFCRLALVFAAGAADIGSIAVAATGREFGLDVSHFQARTGISQAAWEQQIGDGRRFAYIKATEGLTGPDDPAMSYNVRGATAAGLLVGVYHYCHPENRPSPDGARQEAAHFLAYAADAVGPGRLRPVLDLEGRAESLKASALTDWVQAFIDEVVARRGPGAMPILYMNRSFANRSVDERLAGCDLWLAYYLDDGFHDGEPASSLRYPRPLGVFTNWVFWQYSSRGKSGGLGPVDVDVCHSEYKPLTSLVIPSPGVVLARTEFEVGAMRAFEQKPSEFERLNAAWEADGANPSRFQHLAPNIEILTP
jgi:GH25 family lysozyme M1 (1,4-beta-N-acetylmuramidase)